jgi:hypothetical protein
MIATIISLLLVLAAAYTGGAWLANMYLWGSGSIMPSEYAEVNDHMFKLGLCCILALGFAGLIAK